MNISWKGAILLLAIFALGHVGGQIHALKKTQLECNEFILEHYLPEFTLNASIQRAEMMLPYIEHDLRREQPDNINISWSWL